MNKTYYFSPERLRGAFGTPAPGMEIKIIDPESRETLPDGEEGELCVRGYAVMQGYYKREREDAFEPDGFFRTGREARRGRRSVASRQHESDRQTAQYQNTNHSLKSLEHIDSPQLRGSFHRKPGARCLDRSSTATAADPMIQCIPV